MTTEPKLMTEQHAACILAMEPSKALDELRERGLIAPEPVDPLLVEAEAFAELYYSNEVINGTRLSTAKDLALAALRRGKEIGEAAARPLTREQVEGLVRNAADKWHSGPTALVDCLIEVFSAALTKEPDA